LLRLARRKKRKEGLEEHVVVVVVVVENQKKETRLDSTRLARLISERPPSAFRGFLPFFGSSHKVAPKSDSA
jgi:hypothetical protein